MSISQYPPPDHVLLHISDTHFTSGNALLHGVLDSDAKLAGLFETLAQSSIRPEAIIITGDLADAGQFDAYQRLRDLVEPAASRLDARLIWGIGNHDDRYQFRRALLNGEPSTEPIDSVHLLNGLRIISLDTTVPGEHHGEVSDQQLGWLRSVLAQPAPDGSLLAMHHPPLPSPLALIEPFELRDAARLEPILCGSDVRAILSGHLHYSTTATFAGIPVSVAAATSYSQDLEVAYPGGRGQDGGQSFNLVYVYPDTVVHSSVPLGAFPTVYEISPELFAAFAEMSAAERLAALGASIENSAMDQQAVPAGAK